mmetsp:Transcript_127746/g.346715  ORF Transcript_127746/g.346715 Transcript_127746/m.346715 type:complete len:236 (+) Transcript_127746:1799-2506(+)
MSCNLLSLHGGLGRCVNRQLVALTRHNMASVRLQVEMFLPTHAEFALHDHGVGQRKRCVHIAVVDPAHPLMETLGPNGVLDGEHRLEVLVLHFHQPPCSICLLLRLSNHHSDNLASRGHLTPAEELLIRQDRTPHVVVLVDVLRAEEALDAGERESRGGVHGEQLGARPLAEHEGGVERVLGGRHVVHVLRLPGALLQRREVADGLAHRRALVPRIRVVVLPASGARVLHPPAGH